MPPTQPNPIQPNRRFAEAGKFPLRDAYLAGRAQALQDRGFASSQEAAVPELWFEAGGWGCHAMEGRGGGGWVYNTAKGTWVG